MENWAYLTDFLVVKLQCRTESSLSVVPCWGPHVVQYNEDREWTVCDFCCLLWAENLNVSLIGFETSVSWYYNKKNSEYTKLKKNHCEAWWSSFLENYSVSVFSVPEIAPCPFPLEKGLPPPWLLGSAGRLLDAASGSLPFKPATALQWAARCHGWCCVPEDVLKPRSQDLWWAIPWLFSWHWVLTL